MTRKDYAAIAQAIQTNHALYCGNDEGQSTVPPVVSKVARGYASHAIKELTYDLLRILQADNPNFDATRFMNACGF